MGSNLSNPLFVQFEITNQCNHKCNHCYNYWQLERDLANDWIRPDYDFIIDKIVDAKIFHVVLTGGEPFIIKPEIYKIIDSFCENNISISINTNLSLLTVYDIEFLSERKISLLTSIFSSEPIQHDKITQVQGSFKKLITNSKILSKNGLTPGFNMVVDKGNINHIIETAEFLKKEFDIKFFAATPVAKPINKDFEILSKEQINYFLEQLFFILSKINIQVNILNPIPLCFIDKVEDYLKNFQIRCSACKDFLVIDYKGDIRPCNQMKAIIGNLQSESIAQVFTQNEKWRNNDLISKVCLECKMLSYCNGACKLFSVEADYYSTHGIQYHPFAEIIKMTPTNNYNDNFIKAEKFKLNNQVKFRKELFGYTLFLTTSKVLYLNDNEFQVYSLLKEKCNNIWIEREGFLSFFDNDNIIYTFMEKLASKDMIIFN